MAPVSIRSVCLEFLAGIAVLKGHFEVHWVTWPKLMDKCFQLNILNTWKPNQLHLIGSEGSHHLFIVTLDIKEFWRPPAWILKNKLFLLWCYLKVKKKLQLFIQFAADVPWTLNKSDTHLTGYWHLYIQWNVFRLTLSRQQQNQICRNMSKLFWLCASLIEMDMNNTDLLKHRHLQGTY